MASKYHNKKTEYDGHTFDSRAERDRYIELRLLERAGEISKLELQPTFQLLPGFTDYTGKRHRPVTYRADFLYFIEDGMVAVVEDVKGVITKEYALKRKFFLHHYRGIRFREVQA